MPIQILMPALSPTMTEGNLAKWLKKEGDTIKAGEVIAEIETDKATMEVEAVDEGKLGRIIIPAGTQSVAVNTPIAVLLEDGEDASALANAPIAPAAKPPETPKTSLPPAAAALPPPHELPTTASGRMKASPLAKRIAANEGIDLARVSGSGPNGRIVKADVEAAKSGGARSGKSLGAPSRAPFTGTIADVPPTRIPNNHIRKIIAKRLVEAKQTVPHFYLSVDCRIDALLALRKQINATDESLKISVNDFVVRAAALALQAVPAANASWTDEAILQYAHSDISVAVATDNGLITPIVRAAELKSLTQISAETKELVAKARAGKLRPEEFQGGSFSVSNLGMYGVKSFSAIINPPQACILAVGAGEERPVVIDGQIKPATVMSSTLSVDHRAVDGAVGAQFLAAFKALIEEPIKLLMWS